MPRSRLRQILRKPLKKATDTFNEKMDAYNEAEQAVKEAQVEVASKAVESGLKGFCAYYGAKESLAVLSATVNPELVGKDSETSALNLENVKRSLELINELNEIRKSEGLPEFKVIDELFAVST